VFYHLLQHVDTTVYGYVFPKLFQNPESTEDKNDISWPVVLLVHLKSNRYFGMLHDTLEFDHGFISITCSCM
jgi:hypothetical protein